jgi:hypothetical protein
VRLTVDMFRIFWRDEAREGKKGKYDFANTMNKS